MNLLITQNSQNLSHSHTTNSQSTSTTGKQSANPTFSGSHTHSHKLLSWNVNSNGQYVTGFAYSNGGNKALGIASILSSQASMSYYSTCTADPSRNLVESATVTISGTTSGDHTHDFAHTHGTNSNGGTEVRPVDYTYKIWKRTA